MNQTDLNSHLAAIDAGNRSKHALFLRAAAIWRVAQSIFNEYEQRFEQVNLNEDQLDSLTEGTIFAYSDRRPASISLDGNAQTVTLYLQQPYGEHWTDPVTFPYAWLSMTDEELADNLRSMLDRWLAQAQERKDQAEREKALDEKSMLAELLAKHGHPDPLALP